MTARSTTYAFSARGNVRMGSRGISGCGSGGNSKDSRPEASGSRERLPPISGLKVWRKRVRRIVQQTSRALNWLWFSPGRPGREAATDVWLAPTLCRARDSTFSLPLGSTFNVALEVQVTQLKLESEFDARHAA